MAVEQNILDNFLKLTKSHTFRAKYFIDLIGNNTTLQQPENFITILKLLNFSQLIKVYNYSISMKLSYFDNIAIFIELIETLKKNNNFKLDKVTKTDLDSIKNLKTTTIDSSFSEIIKHLNDIHIQCVTFQYNQNLSTINIFEEFCEFIKQCDEREVLSSIPAFSIQLHRFITCENQLQILIKDNEHPQWLISISEFRVKLQTLVRTETDLKTLCEAIPSNDVKKEYEAVWIEHQLSLLKLKLNNIKNISALITFLQTEQSLHEHLIALPEFKIKLGQFISSIKTTNELKNLINESILQPLLISIPEFRLKLQTDVPNKNVLKSICNDIHTNEHEKYLKVWLEHQLTHLPQRVSDVAKLEDLIELLEQNKELQQQLIERPEFHTKLLKLVKNCSDVKNVYIQIKTEHKSTIFKLLGYDFWLKMPDNDLNRFATVYFSDAKKCFKELEEELRRPKPVSEKPTPPLKINNHVRIPSSHVEQTLPTHEPRVKPRINLQPLNKYYFFENANRRHLFTVSYADSSEIYYGDEAKTKILQGFYSSIHACTTVEELKNIKSANQNKYDILKKSTGLFTRVFGFFGLVQTDSAKALDKMIDEATQQLNANTPSS